MSERTHKVDPLTPGARAIQGLRAGVISRLVAGGIDYVLASAVTFGSYVAWALFLFLLDPRGFTMPHWSFGLFLILGFSIMVLYLWLSWATTGRSVGARVMGLRVVNHSGARLHLVMALFRALLCTLVPFALVWCAISRENRSAVDLLMRTSVIHDWPIRVGDVDIANAESKRIDVDPLPGPDH
jgi:uncharacterized RDD family membrane protein YckC